MKYQGKQVAILGYGAEGRAAYDYWSKEGASVFIHDANSDLKLPTGAKGVLGPTYLDNLDQYDLVVRSPGVFPYKFKTKAPSSSVMNEFLARCPAHTIGVTGTKGKGTTATLIQHILKTGGKTAYLGGNIGKSPLEFLEALKPDDYVVLELSNVQLWDITRSPQVAVLLMIAPEHLDWHRENLEEYIATKAKITAFQTPADRLVFHGSNAYTRRIAAASQAVKLPFYPEPQASSPEGEAVWIDKAGAIYFNKTRVCQISDVPLIGAHNLGNACAAIGATLPLVKDSAVIRQAFKTYQTLPHRLELVGEVNGVRYYDDSIATHPLAAAGAIRAFKEPKVLILGGASKGSTDYGELAQAVAEGDVKGVVLVGQTAPDIKRALSEANYQGPIEQGSSSMVEIVKQASGLANPGAVVLLSPACASFGMFSDYTDRGDQFALAVRQLQ